MQEYVLIDSRQLAVEVFNQPESGWNYAQANEPSDSLAPTSVGVHIALRELYAGILDEL